MLRSPTAPPVRRLVTVLRAIAGLVTLLGVTGGLPFLLAWATPAVWELVDDDLRHVLDSPDTGSLTLLVLLAVAWCGWAYFALCVLREIPAQLRGRPARIAHGTSSAQRAAAALIGSVLVLLPAGSALASTSAAPTTAATGPAPLTTPRQVPAPVKAHELLYTVRDLRPAESLWSIAEHQLGDGSAWRTIARLNEGRTMSDGTVFHADVFLQPGWQLRLPASEQRPSHSDQGWQPPRAPAGHNEQDNAARTVPVRSGDSLSDIAARNTGHAANWPKLFTASRNRAQPDGLPQITDPDQIFPGQRIVIPAAYLSPGRQPSDSDVPGHPGGQHVGPDADTAPSDPTGPPAPVAPGRDRPNDRHPGTTSGPHERGTDGTQPTVPAAPPARASAEERAPSASADRSSAPDRQPSHSSRPGTGLQPVAGAFALLAAAVTAALSVRRALQRRRRKPGETIAIAAEPSPAEAQMAQQARPQDVKHLHAALLTLAAAHDVGNPPPVIRAARLSGHSLDVLPEDPEAAAVAPFQDGHAGWWTLPAQAKLVDPAQEHETKSPFPLLVSIGATDDDALLLLNLQTIGVLLLDGQPQHITQVCLSLALELGMSPWSEDIQVTIVGFGADLPQLLPTSRITYVQQPARATHALAEHLLEAQQSPDQAHAPHIVLSATPIDADSTWQLAETLDAAGPGAVVLVAPARGLASNFPEALLLNATTDTQQPLDTRLSVRLQRLHHDAYTELAAALAQCAHPANAAQDAWRHVPDEPTFPTPPHQAALNSKFMTPVSKSFAPPTVPPPAVPTEHSPLPRTSEHGPDDPSRAPADTERRPRIRVLGPPEVTGISISGQGPRIIQLAILLYFRPGRSADALCRDMSPAAPWSKETLNARLQGLRSRLGQDANGVFHIPRRLGKDDPFLIQNVDCDWTEFIQVVEAALPSGADAVEDLEKALSLVRGTPFGGQALPWAAPLQHEMTTRIVDVAHTVATHRLAEGPQHNVAAARQAIAIGLEADQTAEILYRAWARVEASIGNRPGLYTVINRIHQVNEELGAAPETATEQLIDELLHTPTP